MPLVRRIIGMTGQGKTVTIGPPPMMGGLVMKDIKYCLFNEDFSVVGFICI